MNGPDEAEEDVAHGEKSKTFLTMRIRRRINPVKAHFFKKDICLADTKIDFVCGKQAEKLYVQVTYLPASDETIAREFGVYDVIRDNYPQYVVSIG